MNDFHKLRENFQKFLKEEVSEPKETDTIPGYINSEYDAVNKVHKEMKEAFLDVVRASLAANAYDFSFTDRDVKATGRGSISGIDPNWKKWLSADWGEFSPKVIGSYLGIRKPYSDKVYWEGGSSELGAKKGNNLLYFLHHNADTLIKVLQRKQEELEERHLRGKNFSDKEVKEKYKGVLMQWEAYKKAIETYKNYKKVLDTKGRPWKKDMKYDVPAF